MIWQHQQQCDLWTLFSLLGVPKKKCGFVGRASPSIWITAAHCAAPAKIWIQDYNMCELFNFNNRGPWGRIFLVKQTPNRLWTFKNLCPKTCEKDEMYRNVQLHWFSSYTCITPFFSGYTCITPFFSSYTCITPFFSSYTCITPFFVRYIPIYISIHSTFSLFLNLPLGKRLHFSPFHGWVLNCIFFRQRLFEIKTVILENQPTAYLPFLFFFLLPFWPIWNFFPSLPCWSSFVPWSYSSLASRFCKTKS